MGASLDQSRLNNLNRSFQVGSVVDDTPVAIRLKYIGTGTVTSVTFDTDQDFTLVTSDGGTDEYLFATYTDYGLLIDQIKGDGIFDVKILDSLRADTTAGSPFIDGAATITSEGYYDALIDTSSEKNFTFRCTYDRNVGATKPIAGHRVHLQEIVYNMNINAASANGVRVYEWDAVDKTETQIWRAASVDATATTHNWASGEGMISAGVGNDLIVRVIDGTSLTDATGNFMNVSYIRE